jgi:hypothetical protein
MSDSESIEHGLDWVVDVEPALEFSVAALDIHLTIPGFPDRTSQITELALGVSGMTSLTGSDEAG